MRNNLLNLVVLACLSILVYLNSFGNQFVWDDENFIVRNKLIQQDQPTPKYFLEGTENLYRPLRTMLYSATYRVGGLNPVSYHLVGKLLNALTVCVLYALIVLLFGSREGAFWGALLFALHPLHTERVAWITASYDILGDFFWLSAFACYVAGKRGVGRGYVACSLLLFFVGLLSSETAAVTPFVIILYDMTLGREKDVVSEPNARPTGGAILSKFVWIPYFVILSGYILLRFSVLGIISRTGESALGLGSFGIFVTMSGVVAQYFKLMLFPWPLVPIHEVEQAAAPYSASLLASAAGVASAVVAALLYLRKRPGAAFSFLWFFVVVSPNLNIIPTGTFMAERYVYLPSATLSFFVALAFLNTSGRRRVLLAVGCALVAAAYFAATTVRNKDWRNEVALWASAVNADPIGTNVAVANFSSVLRSSGQSLEAEKILLNALKENPRKIFVLMELGEIYLESGRLDEAERSLRKIPPHSRVQYRIIYDMAQIRIKQGRYAEAEKMLGDVLEVHPDAPKTFISYVSTLFAQGKPTWPGHFIAAYAASGNIDFLANLANFYLLSGKNATAVNIAKIGLSVDPSNMLLKQVLENAARSPK
ncbi:MAG: tetratricopeptide repeat protein [Nitrospinae bacterium]|nr:tetratricopeptide repeat protein [Nitrospinota bacterium]